MSLPPNPADKLESAPFNDLMRILLNQFKRLLADKGLNLTADELIAIANAISDYQSHEKLSALQKGLAELVRESLDLLEERWGLNFLDSLNADMDSIDGWESTAEFLDIVNEKSNAELRISAGASLLVAMGYISYIPYLMNILDHDAGTMDVDAAFARRALLHISHVSVDALDWLAQVKLWVEQQ